MHTGSNAERSRIERIIERDGPEQARAWARRTEALYRSAVLDRNHFAHTHEYRRRFIEAYLQLKRYALKGTMDDGGRPNHSN
jgi:hypothetical protein